MNNKNNKQNKIKKSIKIQGIKIHKKNNKT